MDGWMNISCNRAESLDKGIFHLRLPSSFLSIRGTEPDLPSSRTGKGSMVRTVVLFALLLDFVGVISADKAV